MQLNVLCNGAVWKVNAICVVMYMAVGKIRIQKLCLNCTSDPNGCKLQVLLIAVLSLLLFVWNEGKGGYFLEPQRDSWKNGVE